MAEAKAPGSSFTVFERSLRGPQTPEDLCKRLSTVDAVLVLCGVWTHLAPNVNAEVKMAQELGKRYYLIKGRRFRECSRPATARITDKIFKWAKDTTNQLVLRNI